MIDVIDQDRERIDLIALRLYGTARGGTVEALLKANPGLASDLTANAACLARGRTLRVPLKPERRPDPALVRPWE